MGSDTDNNTKNFMVQGTILAAASIVVRLIGMIYRIPLNRILGDEGMGLYGNAFEVYNIALLLSSYSLPLAVSKLVAGRLAVNERKNAFKVFKAALGFAVIVGLVICLVVYFFAYPIANGVMRSPMCVYALRVLAPCLFVVAVMGVIRGFFQGQGTMIPTAVSQIIEQIINAIVSVVAAIYLFKAGTAAAQKMAEDIANADMLPSAYGAAGGTLGTISGAAAGLLFLVVLYALSRPSLIRKVRNDVSDNEESYKDIMKVLMATIIPVILSSALYNVCGILDQAIFNHVMASKGIAYNQYTSLIGMYSGKYLLLINIPLAMANALASSSIPSITASVAKHERRSIIHSKINTAVKFSMLIAIPSFIGFVVLGSPILRLLFKDDRSQMALMLAVGAICVVFYSLSTISNAILQGLDHMKTPLKNACISLAIHIALLFVFLYLGMGIYAVVISNTLFSVAMCILNQRSLRKICGYKQEIKYNFLIPLAASAIMGVLARICYFLFRHKFGNGVSTFAALIVAVIVYLVSLVWLKGLTEEEIRQFPKGYKIAGLFKKIHLLR